MNNYRLVIYFITILILSCGTPPNGWEGSDETSSDKASCSEGQTMDCNGVCGGSAIEDCNGVCNGSGVMYDVNDGIVSYDSPYNYCCPSGQVVQCYAEMSASGYFYVCSPDECYD